MVEYKLDPNITLKITGKLSGPGKFVAHRDNEGVVLVESSTIPAYPEWSVR